MKSDPGYQSNDSWVAELMQEEAERMLPSKPMKMQ
jgi:hypothetical protein